MCGMVGLGRFDGPATPADHAAVTRMNSSVMHRGPDETVEHKNGAWSLGFQRLSLLAPADGRQPFTSRNGDCILMVNGEVYNHRELRAELAKRHEFTTSSDCEVLLHGYLDEGIAFLEQVRGMFSFALIDLRSNALVLGRDRFGIKPLYFHIDQHRIVFASEIKALFQEPSTPRRVAWESALRAPALNLDLTLVGGPITTWFEDIRAVPAAHTVSIDMTSRSVTETPYWNTRAAVDLSDASASEIVERYRDALDASVTECLDADCEVGLLLSGGIDSAAVAAFASDSALHTFTALSGSTVANGDAEFSHRTARHLRLPNHQIMFDTARVPSAEEWRSLLWLLETPQASPEHFYKYELHRFARATRPNLKAMLLGQASDEFNGGYSSKLSSGGGWDGFLRNLSQMSRATMLRSEPALAPWFSPGHGNLLRIPTNHAVDPYQAFLDWKLHDIEQYNTWHEDRTAAGNSIEARVPFLDHRIVELTNGVPVTLRRELFWDKAILRRAMAGLLPAEVIARPKVSFYYDDDGYNNQRTFVRMFTQQSNQLIDDALSSSGAMIHVDPDAMRSAVAGLTVDPSLASMEYVLGVLNLGLLENLLTETPAVQFSPTRTALPEEVAVADWADAEPIFRRRAVDAPTISGDTVFAPARRLRFLSDVQDAHDARVLAVDDVLEYELDAADADAWTRVLRGLDGSLGVYEVADVVSVDRELAVRITRQAFAEQLLEIRHHPTVAGIT